MVSKLIICFFTNAFAANFLQFEWDELHIGQEGKIFQEKVNWKNGQPVQTGLVSNWAGETFIAVKRNLNLTDSPKFEFSFTLEKTKTPLNCTTTDFLFGEPTEMRLGLEICQGVHRVIADFRKTDESWANLTYIWPYPPPDLEGDELFWQKGKAHTWKFTFENQDFYSITVDQVHQLANGNILQVLDNDNEFRQHECQKNLQSDQVNAQIDDEQKATLSLISNDQNCVKDQENEFIQSQNQQTDGQLFVAKMKNFEYMLLVHKEDSAEDSSTIDRQGQAVTFLDMENKDDLSVCEDLAKYLKDHDQPVPSALSQYAQNLNYQEY